MIFLNSASSAAALVFYLPGLCSHTDTEGKQRKARVRNILKSLKKSIFNEHPVNVLYLIVPVYTQNPGRLYVKSVLISVWLPGV